jgi:uncharacterized protein
MMAFHCTDHARPRESPLHRIIRLAREASSATVIAVRGAHYAGHLKALIAACLNWGLVGVANFDLVAAILGQGSILSRIVYGLVGLAGLYGIALALRLGRRAA